MSREVAELVNAEDSRCCCAVGSCRVKVHRE